MRFLYNVYVITQFVYKLGAASVKGEEMLVLLLLC